MILKLCVHRAIGGVLCKAPATRQSDYCRHHARVHRPPVPDYVLAANTFREIQLVLNRTIQDLWHSRLSHKAAGRILFELDKRIRVLKTDFAPKAKPHSSIGRVGVRAQ